jgi:hypothetical protein
MGGECDIHCRDENAYKILNGKPGRKRPIKRPRRIWEDNIKMILDE